MDSIAEQTAEIAEVQRLNREEPRKRLSLGETVAQILLAEPNTEEPDWKSTERVYLNPWEELCGRLVKLKPVSDEVIVALTTGRLHYPRGSHAAHILRRDLLAKQGYRVSILQTDIPDRPVVVHTEVPE